MKMKGITPKNNRGMMQFAHHALTDSQLIPEQLSVPPGQFPPGYILAMMFYGWNIPLAIWGQLSWPLSLPALCAPAPWQSRGCCKALDSG